MSKQPNETQTTYLKLINIVKFCTTSQLMRLLGKDPSRAGQLRVVQTNLAWLKGKRSANEREGPAYIIEIARSGKAGEGKLESIYHLADYGVQYLKSLGIEATGHKIRERDADQDHLLGITEVMVLAQELTRSNPAIALTHCLHEYDLRKFAWSAMPDASLWFALTLDDGSSVLSHRLIEIDSGEQTQEKQITDKINNIVNWLQTDYLTLFKERHGLLIAFLTLAGEQPGQVLAEDDRECFARIW